MKRLLSLFDYTGTWSAPFWDAGWDVFMVDLQHGQDIASFDCASIIEDFLEDGLIDGLIAALPCTEFTVAGSRHWARKDDDGTTDAAVHLAMQTIRTIEFVKPDFWAIENPNRGRIPKIVPFLDKSDFSFHPADFGGRLNPPQDVRDRLDTLAALGEARRFDDMTQADVELTRDWNAYAKETGLWGHFVEPKKDPVPKVRVCNQGSWIQRLPGQGKNTKNERSKTPEGFAQAFFEANSGYALDWDAIEEGDDEYHSPFWDSDVPYRRHERHK